MPTLRKANDSQPRGRGWWIVTVLVALILVACSGSNEGAADQPPAPAPPDPAQNATSSGPKIVFEQELLDLGDLPVDEMFTVDFVYQNVGDAPLTVGERPRVMLLDGC